jgi:dipeptidyl aminopeptidase/acylaminoacyl peptidase
VRLDSTWLRDGVAYWLEGRPAEAGRQVLVSGDPHGSVRDLTPDGFNVRTKVHEYGGGAYCLGDGLVVFSNLEDQRLYVHRPGDDPVAITPSTDGTHRFADGRVTDDGRWWIGVRERHDLGPRSRDVINELVAVPLDGSEPPHTVASGRDFYSNPRVSPDGTELCFLAWDLPWMPWDGCELFVAPLHADATAGEPRLMAGVTGEESIWQPEWSPWGSLVFASDRSGWWNLEELRGGERRLLHPAGAEFGYPAWSFGDRSFGFLDDGRIVSSYDTGGETRFAILDPATGELLDLDLPFDAFSTGPNLVSEGQTVVFIAGSATEPGSVVWLDLTTRSVEVLRKERDVALPAGALSTPERLTIATRDKGVTHAFFYPPASEDSEGPIGELPPLIVKAHGGPTGNTSTALDLAVQFWTTRGFALLDVDYRGSSGYGRDYRRALNGNWGLVDLNDCVDAALDVVGRGLADGDRLIVRGGSAGGYVVLCALAFTDEFAAGATYYGIADLVPFATGDTHKFEMMYEHTLVGPWPEQEEKYRQRSPINSVERLRTPTLVLQGADDEVVPPSQAETIVKALEANGVPFAYLLFEGEGHGFRKAETIVRSISAELSFYGQILGFEPAGEIERLEISNMPSGG